MNSTLEKIVNPLSTSENETSIFSDTSESYAFYALPVNFDWMEGTSRENILTRIMTYTYTDSTITNNYTTALSLLI